MSLCLFCSRRTVKLDMLGKVPTMEYCRNIFESCNKYICKELKGNHFKWNYSKEWPIQFCSICLEFSDELFRIESMLKTHIESFSKYIRTRAKVHHESGKIYVSHSNPEKCNDNENRKKSNEDEDHIINIMSGTTHSPNVFPKMEPEEQDIFLDEAEIKTEFVETFDEGEEGFLAAPLHIELSSNCVSTHKEFPVNYLTNVQDRMIVLESNNVSKVMEENQISQPLEESSKQASISFATSRKQKSVFNSDQILTDSTVRQSISEANAKKSIPTPRKHTGAKINRGRWRHEEDEKLKSLVVTLGEGSWKEIAKNFPDRSEMQCATRWAKVLSPNIIKGQWTRQEDEKIVQLVEKYGPSKWTLISKHLKGRIGKQCRERWTNHLKPEINKDPWTEDEDRMIYEAHCKFGNQWSTIANFLPGRTDNSIKNRWNCTIKRKMFDFCVNRKRGKKK